MYIYLGATRMHSCKFPVQRLAPSMICIIRYRMAGNFHGVLIFIIFVVDLAVMKISTHEN